jgi:acyl-CoA dehydrogenase
MAALGTGVLGDTLDWPFFEAHHRDFAERLSTWADAHPAPACRMTMSTRACRARVKTLGEAGFLRAAVPADYGGLHAALDVRTLCLAREILAARDGLADFAFAMQGARAPGSISVAGSPEMKARILPAVGAR